VSVLFLKQMAQYAIDDCQEFLELYEGVQINKPLAQKIDAAAFYLFICPGPAALRSAQQGQT
jgi:hypothetical protein